MLAVSLILLGVATVTVWQTAQVKQQLPELEKEGELADKHLSQKDNVDQPRIEDISPTPVSSVQPIEIDEATKGAANNQHTHTSLNSLNSSLPSVRGKAAMELYGQMEKMSEGELNTFWNAMLTTVAENPCQADWLELTWTLNMVAHDMMERELLTQEDVDKSLAFLADYVADTTQTLNNRRIAIQTIGMAGVSSAGDAVAALLADPQNWEVEEIARSAAVALAAIKHPQAMPLIARILDATETQSIGDSAAYALGELAQLSAVPHLVAYSERTGSNLSPDTALRKMRPEIVATLENAWETTEQRIACIRATGSFFSEEEESNQDYLAPLCNIAVTPAVETEVREAAIKQLLEYAKMTDLQTGNKVLGTLLPHLSEEPQFADAVATIKSRLNARPLELIPVNE